MGPRPLAAAVMAFAVIAAACGSDGGDGLEATDGGVQTVDAADASTRRAELALAAAGGSTDDDDPVEEETPQATFPPITEDVSEPDPGLRAIVTPTGVVVGVTGVTETGFVVETPCGATALVEVGQSVGEVQIVLDPGHGGDEPGALDAPVLADATLTEAELNLAVARRTREELGDRSISAVLTRDGDYRMPLTRRAALADRIGPEAFISIHHNTPASRPSPVPGTEVYIQNGSAISKRLGGLLYEHVFATLSEFDVAWTSRDDAGVLVVLNDAGDDSYGIARYPTTPTALVELAYLGNEAEAELLRTPEYVDAAAIALADGIEQFLTTDNLGSGFRDEPRFFNPLASTGGSTGCVDPRLE